MRELLNQASQSRNTAGMPATENGTSPLPAELWLRTFELPMLEAAAQAAHQSPMQSPMETGAVQAQALNRHSAFHRDSDTAKMYLFHVHSNAGLQQTARLLKNIAAQYPEENDEGDYRQAVASVMDRYGSLHAPFHSMSERQCELLVDMLVQHPRSPDNPLHHFELDFETCLRRDNFLLPGFNGPTLGWEHAAFWLNNIAQKHPQAKVGLNLSCNDGRGAPLFPNFVEFLKQVMQKGIFTSLNFRGTPLFHHALDIIKNLPQSGVTYLNLSATHLALPARPSNTQAGATGEAAPRNDGRDISSPLRNSQVTHLDLSHNTFREGSFQTILDALPGSRITHLAINNATLSPEDMENLFETLKHPDCKVTHLDLSGIEVLRNQGEFLAEKVKGTKLHHLEFGTDTDIAPAILDEQNHARVMQSLADNRKPQE